MKKVMFASFGGAIAKTSLTFVSKYAMKAGIPEKLKLKKTAVAVSNTRKILLILSPFGREVLLFTGQLSGVCWQP